jgi:hypothetical protein
MAACLAAPGTAGAQGNGRPKGPKTQPSPPPGVTTTTTTSPSSMVAPAVEIGGGTGFRQFGTWLEDASAPVRGEGYTNVGVGYWRLAGMTQTNVPMLGAGLGLSDRVGVSATVPFYRTDAGGTTARGMDDVYLGGTYNVVDPTLTVSEIGLSVGGVVEVLSAGNADGRVHFAVPVAIELRRAPFRVYGTAGYFTRGAVFSGGALEWTGPRQFVVSGVLTQSRSIKADMMLDGLAVPRQRADVMAGVAHAIGRSATGYVSIGRSLTSLADGGTSLSLNGGVSLRFSTPRATP